MAKKIRILHVDDNHYDRQLVKDAIQKEHDEFEVVEADSRKSFEKCLSEGDFDLVLSDFNILGFDGLQVLQVVKEKYPDLPVIIVTGTGSEEIAIQAMKMGAADYVIKSVHHIQGLVPTIQLVLGHKKIQVENKRTQIALKESEELYRSIYENTSVAILLTAEDGRILSANDFACGLFNMTEEEIRRAGRTGLIDYTDRNAAVLLKDRIRSGRGMGEITFVKKDGSKFKGEVSSVIFLDKEGHERISMVIRDLTEQKIAEEDLREREEFLSSIIDNIPDMIFIKDARELKFVRLNKGGEKLLGHTIEELIGKNDYDLFPREQADFFTKKDREVLESGMVCDIPEESIDAKTGRRIMHTKKMTITDKNGKPAFLLGISEDITERKLAEEKLKEYTERLRGLTAYLDHVREDERVTLARNLHDILGSSLTGMKMELMILRQDITDRYPEVHSDIIDRIQSMSGLIDSTIGLMRKLVKQLRTGILEELGLSETIIWYSREIEQRSGIEFNISIIPEEIKMNVNRSLLLFLIFQEILTNVVQHAKASKVNVSIRIADQNLLMKVDDNGTGITEEAIQRQDSFGMLGMKERVILLHGKIEIKGIKGKGTTIRVEIPVESDLKL